MAAELIETGPRHTTESKPDRPACSTAQGSMKDDADVHGCASRVGDAMLPDPTVHEPSISVQALRMLFGNRNLHMVLLVEQGRLIAAVERTDLERSYPAEATGMTIGTVDGRTIGPGAPLAEALRLLDATGGRRLAVLGDDGELLGLLCLKSRRCGFCSSQDVRDHRADGQGLVVHAEP